MSRDSNESPKAGGLPNSANTLNVRKLTITVHDDEPSPCNSGTNSITPTPKSGAASRPASAASSDGDNVGVGFLVSPPHIAGATHALTPKRLLLTIRPAFARASSDTPNAGAAALLSPSHSAVGTPAPTPKTVVAPRPASAASSEAAIIPPTPRTAAYNVIELMNSNLYPSYKKGIDALLARGVPLVDIANLRAVNREKFLNVLASVTGTSHTLKGSEKESAERWISNPARTTIPATPAPIRAESPFEGGAAAGQSPSNALSPTAPAPSPIGSSAGGASSGVLVQSPAEVLRPGANTPVESHGAAAAAAKPTESKTAVVDGVQINAAGAAKVEKRQKFTFEIEQFDRSKLKSPKAQAHTIG